MIEIITIDHIVLRTSKLDKMLNFYCQVLGCKIERKIPEVGLTQLRAGNALIDLVDVDSELGKLGGGPPSKKENNLDHFCLQLRAVSPERLKQHLAGFDIELGQFKNRYGAQGFGPSLYIKDPEGNIIELKSQMTSK